MSQLDRQVGGGHYKLMGIQPFELTLRNFGYEGLRATIYNKVNKYLARDKDDFYKHIEDLEKAIHCLQYQLEVAHEEAGPKVDQAKEPQDEYDSVNWDKVPDVGPGRDGTLVLYGSAHSSRPLRSGSEADQVTYMYGRLV